MYVLHFYDYKRIADIWIILLFFVVGVLIGWLIRKLPILGKAANWGSTILLGFLIFLMGISTGSKPEINANFSQLGLIALALAFGGIAGSILFVLPASRKFTEKKE